MKQLLLAASLLFCLTCLAQTKESESTIKFDSALAEKLGADDYGMKKYVFAYLKEGKTIIKDTAELARIQIAHLKNIQKLAAEGKLILAGPFLDHQPVRGIFIFNVTSLDEARKLTESDPAVKAGLLEMELRPWYGSAALIETVKIHNTIQRKNISE